MYFLGRKGFKWLHPILRRLMEYYLSEPRWYKYDDIKIKVLPGVFHPGFFFSTGFLIDYLRTQDIESKRILELGAGSGLISIFCAKKGAHVTSTDISPIAVSAIIENAYINGVSIEVIQSDLFEKLQERTFDYIIINPPYYPKKAKNYSEMAWYCGPQFEYFQALFKQLSQFMSATTLMVLSEDCDLEKIKSIAAERMITRKLVATKKFKIEENYIYQLILRQD